MNFLNQTYPKGEITSQNENDKLNCQVISHDYLDKKVSDLDINSKLFTDSCKKIHESENNGIITRKKLKNCDSISSLIRYSKRLLETEFTVPVLPPNTLTIDDMELGYIWGNNNKTPNCTTLFKYYFLNSNYPTLKTIKLKETCWGKYLEKEILNGLNGIVKRSKGHRIKGKGPAMGTVKKGEEEYYPYDAEGIKSFIRISKLKMEGTLTFSSVYNMGVFPWHIEKIYLAPMFWKILAFEDYKLHYLDWVE